MISVTLNGAATPLEDATTLAALVESLAPGTSRGVAVALNGEVVARSAWEATAVAEGDRVEILRAAQGGC